MNKNTLPIIVLTPVKNEEWIIERFLLVTCQFADLIIIADQNSTDRSRKIAKNFSKVVLINNKSDNFNENERQTMLIQKARELVPGTKILLALDADEIMAANAQASESWLKMQTAKPGTVFYFEKPDLCFSTTQCIRFHHHYWPLGYVDDGVEHNPRVIHSFRIPISSNSQIIHVHDVKFIHYNLIRYRANASKRRMYCAIENLTANQRWHRRCLSYRASIDWTQQGPVETCPKEWFQGWEDLGIDMHSIQDSEFYWYDVEVLKYIQKYGEVQFHWDDIWNYNWEDCRQWAIEKNLPGIPQHPIQYPNLVKRITLKFAQYMLLKIQSAWRLLKRL